MRTIVALAFVLHFTTACGQRTATYVSHPATGAVPRLTAQGYPFDPNIVAQGYGNDCWFLSTLAAYAYAAPHVLDNAMHVAGDTVDVTLFNILPRTATLPLDLGEGYPGNVGPRVGNWPAWFEQAYVELGRTALDHIGSPAVAMRALTGRSAIRHSWDAEHPEPRRTVAELLSHAETAPTVVCTSATAYLAWPTHCYTVLHADELGVMLYNPAGFRDAFAIETFHREFTSIFVGAVE